MKTKYIKSDDKEINGARVIRIIQKVTSEEGTKYLVKIDKKTTHGDILLIEESNLVLSDN